MKKPTRYALAIGAVAFATTLTLAGCSTDAHVVDANMTKEAESFKVERKITFINGITDKVMLVIEGRCSTENEGKQLTVLCKTGAGEYKKHFLGLSDNVTYVTQQVDSVGLSAYHYKVIFKPETLVPDFDLNTSK
jgi:hypothetical protein